MFLEDYRSLVRFREEKMTKVNLYESHRMFADLYCLKNGQEQKVHTHDDEDKIYFVLDGEVVATTGRETRPIHAGEACVAPAREPHGIRNDSGKDALVLVCMAPHPKPPASD